jgi:hypothetical protein
MSATGKWYTRHIQQKAQQRNSLRQRVMHFHFAHVTPAHIRQGLYIQTLSEPLRAIEQNRAEKAVPVMKLLLDDLRHWNIGVAPPIFERGIDLAAFGEQPIILVGIGLQIAQLVVSIRRRDQLRDETGDPWNGRSLEWATPSPPPDFNFAVLPNIHGEEAYWGMKQHALQQSRLSEEPAYAEIEMPRSRRKAPSTLLALPKPHARAAAVFVQEFDAGLKACV